MTHGGFFLLLLLVAATASPLKQRNLLQATSVAFYGPADQYVYLDNNWAGRSPGSLQLTVPADDAVQFVVNTLPFQVTANTQMYAHIYKYTGDAVAVSSALYKVAIPFTPQPKPYTDPSYCTLLGPDSTTSIQKAFKSVTTNTGMFAIVIPASLLGGPNNLLSNVQYYVGFDVNIPNVGVRRFQTQPFYVQRFPLTASKSYTTDTNGVTNGEKITWNYRHGTPSVNDKIALVCATTTFQWYYIHSGTTVIPTTTQWSGNVVFALPPAGCTAAYKYYYNGTADAQTLF